MIKCIMYTVDVRLEQLRESSTEYYFVLMTVVSVFPQYVQNYIYMYQDVWKHEDYVACS